MTNLLLTGGAGFLGSHLARHILEATDWRVTVLDRLDEAGTLERVVPIKEQYGSRIMFAWHDLKAELNPLLLRGDGPFDFVAHLAAASHVDRSIRAPVAFVLDNVLGTANLLEYVRHHQPQAKLLYFSTDEVFGPAPVGVVFDEYSRFEPENPYAATKAGAEMLCPAYAHQYGMSIAVSHCSNAYGPGQYAEKFIPLVIRKVLNGEMVQIHSRAGVSSSRLYIHVDDVSRAVVTILQKGGIIQDAHTGRFNIVAAEELSNLYVAKAIADILGRPLLYELCENPPGRPKPDQRYAISGEKLKALGWAPKVDFMQGLEATVLSEVKAIERAA